jgi:hypothetical protein
MDEQDQLKAKIKEPPVLFGKTQGLIARIGETLGAPLLAYWNNPRGSVCPNDVIALYEVLGKLGHQKTLYLFLKSGGGSGQSSLRIVSLLRQHCDRLIAVIPLECASAATMIALGSDQVLMGPMAYLTAVDTSLNHALSPVDRDNDRVSVSLDELTRVIRLWRTEQSGSEENPYQALFQHVHPLVIGAVDRAESLSIMLCKQLLAYHISDESTAERIAQTLNSKYPSHSYPILIDERGSSASRGAAAPASTTCSPSQQRYEMGQNNHGLWAPLSQRDPECPDRGHQVCAPGKDWFIAQATLDHVERCWRLADPESMAVKDSCTSPDRFSGLLCLLTAQKTESAVFGRSARSATRQCLPKKVKWRYLRSRLAVHQRSDDVSAPRPGPANRARCLLTFS